MANTTTDDDFLKKSKAQVRAFELLEAEGVTPSMLFQFLIENRDGRKIIARTVKGEDPDPVYDSLYINSLMRDVVFASKNEGIPSFASQFLSDKGIRRLMTTLSSLEVAVIECAYRLSPRRQIELTVDLAVRQGIPHTRVLQIERQAIDKMRRQYAILTAAPPAITREIAGMYIAHLQLSDRAFHALDRNGVSTVGQLVSKREDELLRYANFTQKCLDEVNEKLSNMRLRLAG